MALDFTHIYFVYRKRNSSKIIKKINNIILWQGLWVVYCTLIYYLSSLSNPPDIYTFPLSDKIKHVLEYLLLAILTFLAFHKLPGEFFRRYYYILAILFCIIYGASDELHQGFVANRDSNVMDWFADVIGMSIGGVLYWLYNKKRKALPE